MSDKGKAYIAALLYACTIGFSFLFVKISLRYAGPLDALAHRFDVAMLFALLPLLTGRAKLDATPRGVAAILPLAAFNPVLFFLLQTSGLVYIRSSEAGLIQATAPVFVLLLGLLFLKERTNGRQVCSMLLSVGGVLFVSAMGREGSAAYDPRGVLLAVSSTVSFALYTVLTRKYSKQFSVYTLTFVMSLAGFLAFNAVSLVIHIYAGTVSAFLEPLSHPPYLGAILFLGGASSFFSSFFSNYALSKLEASSMIVFANLATLIAVIAGVVFLGEPFGWYHAVGGLAIVLGVLGTNFFGEKK